MSVPKDRRSEGELAVNTMARGICTYILHIIGNPKNFPPEQMWFNNHIRETALHIDLCCWKANNIRVEKSQELFEKRMKLEAEAIHSCTTMLELINIGRQLYHMPTSRYKYITSQYVELRKKIYNWYKSDHKRLNPIEK